MPPNRIRRALISVHDKTGVVDFARALHDEFGIEIISTGGTARTLKESGIPVTLVEDITGFPEMLDGRVKTLHPKIHAAILADRDNPDHMRQLKEQGIEPIDMVVVNLYPFEQTIAKPGCTFEEAIENIDIGGPCLLRAAAKNHKHVLVCGSTVQPESIRRPAMQYLYEHTLAEMRNWSDAQSSKDFLLQRAREAFAITMMYDARISEWLGTQEKPPYPERNLRLIRECTLRYGENPHQSAALFQLYGEPTGARLAVNVSSTSAPMSFNNLLDANASQNLLDDLSRCSNYRQPRPCCVFVKHNNACGVGIDDNPMEAYRKAYRGDPNAAMGGVLAVNFEVGAEFAQAVMETLSKWGRSAGASAFFLEVWLAPGFTDDSVVCGVIQASKPWGRNVRLIDTGYPDEEEVFDPLAREYRTVGGDMLVQSRDVVGLNEDQWKVVTKRAPTESEMSDLRLAWLIAKHTKSNAISICKDGMLIGNGAGQMSRVMSCRIATWLAKENGHADKMPGSVAASDAFFPFRDGPDILIEAGVTAIIQPGGSKRDADTIAACDERNVAMIFTGTRHFKH